IGEHTDYNEGFVLPAAIDKSIILAIRLNEIEKVRLYALDKQQASYTDISGSFSRSEQDWLNYLLGVIDQLLKNSYQTSGFDCVFGGNVPIGAGMSSSAALEAGLVYGLNQLLELQLSPVKMAQIAQQAENNFVGVQCGSMDQLDCLNELLGNVEYYNCRSLEYEN